jgi:predicted glycoside hydrolase/deacetylase ChbG (UPF0249 family)
MSGLIINADDFGYTDGINRAILALRRAGALSSTTVMATGAALQPASLEAAQSAGLAMGCHIVLVDGSPASASGHAPSQAPYQRMNHATDHAINPPPVQSSTLLRAGRFRPTLGQFARDLTLGRITERAILDEAIAQIRLLQHRGVRITHLDTHKHTHLFPRVLRPLVQAALECGVPAIRNPYEPPWAQSATLNAPTLRRLQTRILNRGRSYFQQQIRFSGLRTTAGALGVLATGTLNAASLEHLLQALARHGSPSECYELVCHPGEHDANLDTMPTRLRAERAREASALATLIPRWTAAGAPHRLIDFQTLAPVPVSTS